MCDRINSFLLQNNIINKNQFGFQKKSGTSSAAATLVDLIQNNCDVKGNAACCVFLDLKKAFDTVPHNNLLKKLENYGMRGNINCLIRNYLNNRHQIVDLTDICSASICNENSFGVPQGSNLGPLLFLIYINGIFDLKLNGILILFADDAVLVYFHTDYKTLNECIQEDIDAIEKWLVMNKLTLNADKTKFMLCSTQKKMPTEFAFQIKMCDKFLQQVSQFKYLGLNICDNLSWEYHIDSICRKVNGFASVMKRLGHNVHTSTKISVYYAMIHSHLTYLSPIWGVSATQNDLGRLQVAQNNAIRNIFNFEHSIQGIGTSDIKRNYGVLDVKQLIVMNSVIMFFKIKNNQIKCNYEITDRAHQYQTRNRDIPRTNVPRTKLGKFSTFRSSLNLFHSLNANIRAITNIHTFKKKIKNELLNHNIATNNSLNFQLHT